MSIRSSLVALAFAATSLTAGVVRLSAITPNQIDDFQAGTALLWGNGGAAPQPVNIASGGPTGGSDRFLQITSDGNGAGGKLTIFNRDQWVGNYGTAGVTKIELDAKVIGGGALVVRLSFRTSTQQGSSGYVTTNGLSLPNDGAWHHVVFDLTAMTPFGNPPALTTVLAAPAEMRIFHAAQPNTVLGDNVVGQLGIDNIKALPNATATGRLVNVATRARIETGDAIMIAGFVITGSAPKRVIVRGIGPSLASAGVANVLADPQMTLISNGATVGSNDNWQSAANAADVTATGLAPSDPRESAILATLTPGVYTALVSGVNSTSGVALVEVYDLDALTAAPRVINLSTRARVQTGDNVEIVGFAIRGGSRKVLVRAIGPSFAGAVPGPLANPTLTLISAATGQAIATNDDWQNQAPADVTSIQTSGFAPSNPLESAILLTLPEGNYTGIMSGVGGTSGIGSVEVYEVN